jgi:hypothetical protein
MKLNMKKQYIKPETEVVLMKNTCCLLAGSDPESKMFDMDENVNEGWGD